MGTNHSDGKPVLLKKDEVSMTNGAPSMHGRQHGNFSVVYHLSMEQLVRTWRGHRQTGEKFLLDWYAKIQPFQFYGCPRKLKLIEQRHLEESRSIDFIMEIWLAELRFWAASFSFQIFFTRIETKCINFHQYKIVYFLLLD